MTSNITILRDPKKLARLKRSIGHDHAIPRPLYPIEVAKHLQELKEELNDEMGIKTARRLRISTSLLSDFFSLLELPPKYADVWGWGTFSGGRIPWSMFRRAGKFYSKGIISEDDLGILINGVLENQIPTASIEDILYLKKRNPNKSFKDCCNEILKLIPKKITYIVFISDLDATILENMQKRASVESKTLEQLSESILAKFIKSEHIRGVMIKQNAYIKIGLTEQGRKNLGDVAKNENVLLTEVINHIFTKSGF